MQELNIPLNKSYSLFKRYLNELLELRGQGTEHSYRASLINLISEIFDGCKLINEPKSESMDLKIDIRVLVGDRKVGYIETKDIGINLDKVLESEQLKRYMSSIHNLILTDYLNFILIRNGTVTMRAVLMHGVLDKSLPFRLDERDMSAIKDLIQSFLQYQIPQITSAELLADYLAKKAKLLKMLSTEGIISALQDKPSPLPLKDFVLLISPLLAESQPTEYVDAYAQTMTFGILLAKSMGGNRQLTRDNAARIVPSSVRIIRRILMNIIEPDLPTNISWIIDDIFDVVNTSDLNKILSEIKDKTGAVQDAFLLFYEDFLGNYDPDKRKNHGVYYTPRPVVSFIVMNINRILREEFGKELSLGSDDVTILDPATGTGTFLAMAQLAALLSVKRAGYNGMIEEKIKRHILKDFFGFELLVAPYVISHLKLTRELEKTWGYQFSGDDRVQVYLTNTLQDTKIENLYAFDEILQETRIASEVKQKKKVLVILGNPPYAGFSQNKGGYIEYSIKDGKSLVEGSKLQGYYTLDDAPLQEKNPKWLLDDYVKFIRFGQLKIDQSGEGIMAYVSNNGYLDNPTFAGMRQSLLKTFDTIYVVNLHGSSRKREGVAGDENVFNIMQGVTITFFIKHKDQRPQKIRYAEVFGNRETKFKWLNNRFFSNIEFEDINPVSPQYFYIPHQTDAEYQAFPSMPDIFKKYSVGIATARDSFTLDFEKDSLKNRLAKFLGLPEEEARQLFSLGKDVQDWKVKTAQDDVRESKLVDDMFTQIAYRPFDYRYTYYTGKSRGLICRPRTEIMSCMLKENIAIVTTRGSRPEPWRDVFASTKMTDIAVLSGNTSRSSYHFPLYLYKNDTKEPNIKPEIIDALSRKYERQITPELIFYYVYGILNSKKYRNKYDSELQRNFPKVWLPQGYEELEKVAQYGNKLLRLHTMEMNIHGILGYPEPGNNKIEFVKFKENKIYINGSQYFDGCTNELWEFSIGSYKVLEKWLKSRKGQTLKSMDIEFFSKIAAIITNTLEIENAVDAFISLN